MKIKLLTPLAVLLLAACTTPAPVKVPVQPPSVSVARDVVAILLSYHHSMESASQADLSKELAALSDARAGAETEVRKAIVLGLMRDSIKLARARTILAGVLSMDDPDALALRPLVEWMGNNYSELRRVTFLGERQAQQLRDALHRYDQLNEKLEAMKRIESSQPASPIEIAPAK
jgi:hypothetical protein